MGLKDKIFYQKTRFEFQGRFVDLVTPQVMGILNVTPDSFFAESRLKNVDSILSTCEMMIKDGATILDVGGYSSRPGAREITTEEEINRTASVIELIGKNFPDIMISIDTFRTEVARIGVQHGASMVNDISGGELDDSMFGFIANQNIPYVLTHMQGKPSNMQDAPSYTNASEEISKSLSVRLKELYALGAQQVLVDPGFGLGKTMTQNFELLHQLDQFSELKSPILVGISRKSMIYNLLETTPDQALNGTTVLNTIALERGAKILRVHDVKEASECIKLWSACTNQD